MSAAGYNVVYKGKWHCSKPAGATWSPSDLSAYGFSRWNPDDAGANQSIPEMGGGIANNDGRFMTSVGDYAAGDEGALAVPHLDRGRPAAVLHDHLAGQPPRRARLPAQRLGRGLQRRVARGRHRPARRRWTRTSASSPARRQAFLKIFNLSGKLRTVPAEAQLPELLRQPHAGVGQLPGQRARGPRLGDHVVGRRRCCDDTLVIRTADHGEMGLAHGGLRQKNFNFYEESIRVPLVYSNPKLFKKPRRSSALVSHVDFLPTLAEPLRRAPERPLGVAGPGLLVAGAARATARARAGLRRLHLRRLPGRAGLRPLRAAAAAHHQHPRDALEARRSTTTRPARSGPSGRCTT